MDVRYELAKLKAVIFIACFLLKGQTHLERAVLEEAHLEGAYLLGADLEGADLSGAHLLLGRGAALVPLEQSAALKTAFDELGVVYDAVSVWRPTT